MNRTNHSQNEHFDDFFYEVWDYVSDKVVDDNFWDDNIEMLKEVTFSFYTFNQKLRSPLKVKEVGKLLEDFFHNILKNGIRIRK